MRKPPFLRRFAGSALTAAMCITAADAAEPRPEGTCTPPGAWAARADFPSSLGGAIVRAWAQFFPPNGHLYLMGGRFDDTAGDDFMNIRFYDPASDSWTSASATFEDNQVNNMVGGVLDFGGISYIVVVGGSAAGATISTSAVRQYDPIADTFIPLSSDPWIGNMDGMTLPGGAAVYNNKLYVFGGFDIGFGMLNSIYRFDPSAAEGTRWTQMVSVLPMPIGYIPTATSNGLIYLLGGSTFDVVTGTLQDSTESSVFSPDTDTIQPISPIPRATAETRAVTQTDGKVWVLGGGRVAPNPSNEVDIYDPTTDTWTTGPAFTNPRRNLAADIDPATGDIWTIGGYDSDGLTPLAFNEEFTPCVVIDDRIFADGFDGTP